MKFKAFLSRSTTDNIKSKILSPKLTQITIDAYITPSEFALLMENFFDKSFVVELWDDENSSDTRSESEILASTETEQEAAISF